MLRVEVLAGPHAARVAELLGEHDDLVEVDIVPKPVRAALVIGDDEEVADLSPSDDVWERIGPFARRLARLERPPLAPAVLDPHDPAMLVAGRRLTRRMARALAEEGLDDGSWTYDHIGSTSVSGLSAKPILDLQIGMTSLPDEEMDTVFTSLGYMPARGPRPDSPGVYRDMILEPGLAPDDDYRKRLYFRPDPGLTSILHVRLLGSPWWSYTVLFRNWLRTEPQARLAYQTMKEQVAAEHADEPDYDGYTWGKVPFFHEKLAEFKRIGGPYRVRR